MVVFLTVFIDLVGFGIVVPLVPVFGKHLVPETMGPPWVQGLIIGVIVSCFSAMQFIFSPIWGRLSDRHGRRPILLLSTAGAAVSYAVFAVGCGLENHVLGLWLLIISRSFAGICGGNITVAHAYIADITPPEKRSVRMGFLGMAFGLGFIFGPAIGGMALSLGNMGPGLIAAGLCAGNFVLAWFILSESRKAGSRSAVERPHIAQWLHTLRQPRVGLLVVVFFLATFCFSCFEATLPLLVGGNFNLDFKADAASASTVTALFVYCGVIGALVQGGAIGRLVKLLGEPNLIALSLLLTAVSLGILPFIKGSGHLTWAAVLGSPGWGLLLGSLAILAVGTSLTRAPLFGLMSNLTSADEQGATLGVAQGAGSLARILGPPMATALLPLQPALPYLICTGILLLTTFLVLLKMSGTTVGHVGGASTGEPSAATH
jgi:MFS transporter, DHA1 family, tetracycline resistance protein